MLPRMELWFLVGQGDAGNSNDHFTGICAQFPKHAIKPRTRVKRELITSVCVPTRATTTKTTSARPTRIPTIHFPCNRVGNPRKPPSAI